MPRFSIKDLLLTTTLVAIGLTMVSLVPAVEKLVYPSERWGVLIAIFFFGGWGLVGAGLGTPFRHPILSGLLMILVVLVLVFVLAAYYD
jgi:hypothetical protein